jgi:Trypsin-co-occurring domain 1
MPERADGRVYFWHSLRVSNYVEFSFDDGQAVMIEVFPHPGAGPGADEDGRYGQLVPVAGGGRVRRAAGAALTQVLRPLVPVLESVHRTVAGVEPRPESVSVQLAVRISGDLRLGIVSNTGEASFSVSATWKTEPQEPTGAGRGSEGTAS